MRLRTRVIGAAGIAAVVAAGGSAFTASNTGVPLTRTLGDSSTAVTGAAVSAMAFTLNTDNSKVNDVVYTLASALQPTSTASITVTSNDADRGGPFPYTCTPDVETSLVLTCATTATVGATDHTGQLTTAEVSRVELLVK